MKPQIIKLKPIKESTKDYETLEKRIKKAFWDMLFSPILKDLEVPRETIVNAKKENPLLAGIRSGKIMFSYGRFTGRFSAGVSRELKELGAKWEKSTSSFKILKSELPENLKHAISASSNAFERKLKKIDLQLQKILPEEIADRVKSQDLFSSTLWKVDREFRKTIGTLTIAPDLPPHRVEKIADEWQTNMDLWIKNFTEEQITELREKVQKSAFKGARYESLISTIQKSYLVTGKKARFLARQETSLLMTKFKESRYTDVGIQEYEWRCVAGSPNHPVRPAHKRLDGKIFRWDNPPITTAPGEPVRRNNPGEDYNCRCFARPLVRFRNK